MTCRWPDKVNTLNIRDAVMKHALPDQNWADFKISILKYKGMYRHKCIHIRDDSDELLN